MEKRITVIDVVVMIVIVDLYFPILCSYNFVVLSCIACKFLIYAQIRRRGH